MKALEKHLGYWLRYVSNQVSNTFAKSLKTYEISVAEWVILNVLSEAPRSPAKIAETIGMTRGATSKVIDKLFTKGWIVRIESKEDRRFQEIHLSDSGKKLLPKLRQIADHNDEHFFGQLSISDQKTLMRILKEIVSKHQWDEIPLQ